MPLREVLKEIDAKLYPDIVKAGSISAAISNGLADMGSPLVGDATEVDDFMPYGRVEEGSRFSQIKLTGGERLFLVDFWSEGVMFGSGSSPNLSDVARAIHGWLIDKATLEKMSSQYDFFLSTDGGKAHEAGNYVEEQWQGLIETWEAMENPFRIRSRKHLSSYLFSLSLIEKFRILRGYFSYLNNDAKKYSPLPLIRAAMKRSELRQLYPYTSLTQLCFSRTTGYPFTKDCPVIAPQENGKYAVFLPISNEFLGEYAVEDALDVAINKLPPNCGPAVNGTADNFVPL